MDQFSIARLTFWRLGARSYHRVSNVLGPAWHAAARIAMQGDDSEKQSSSPGLLEAIVGYTRDCHMFLGYFAYYLFAYVYIYIRYIYI